MLVLSRGKSEIIKIDDDITICILKVKGGRVRVGIDAPANVRVHRGEIYDAIKQANDGESKT